MAGGANGLPKRRPVVSIAGGADADQLIIFDGVMLLSLGRRTVGDAEPEKGLRAPPDEGPGGRGRRRQEGVLPHQLRDQHV